MWTMAVAAGLAAGVGTVVTAAPITPGNLVVYRVGDGTTSLGSSAAAVSLLEYTPTGTLQQTINLDTTGSNVATQSGSATSNGALAISPDGSSIGFMAYGANAGTASVTGTSAATTPRVVGRLDVATGTVDVSTRLTDSFNADNARGAVWSGNTAWMTGNSNSSGSTAGVRTTTLGSTSGTSVSSTVTNTRTVRIFNGQLYMDTGSGTMGAYTVGSGLPTASGTTSTLLVGTGGSQGSSDSPYAFLLFDLNPNIAGLDTAYIADDRNASATTDGGIQKWSFDGSLWSLSYVLNHDTSNAFVSGLRGLTGYVNTNGQVQLFATAGGTSNNSIYGTLDTGSSAQLSLLVSAGSNYVFRGIEYVIPEPASMVLLALGGVFAGLRRRRA
jgi:hypothetical protein